MPPSLVGEHSHVRVTSFVSVETPASIRSTSCDIVGHENRHAGDNPRRRTAGRARCRHDGWGDMCSYRPRAGHPGGCSRRPLSGQVEHLRTESGQEKWDGHEIGMAQLTAAAYLLPRGLDRFASNEWAQRIEILLDEADWPIDSAPEVFNDCLVRGADPEHEPSTHCDLCGHRLLCERQRMDGVSMNDVRAKLNPRNLATRDCENDQRIMSEDRRHPKGVEPGRLGPVSYVQNLTE